MAKSKRGNGYTFWYKDWTNSESVFELNLEERGLYRELIDLSYQCDNKIQKNVSLWTRKWNSEASIIARVIARLLKLGLITENLDIISVPSSEKRLILIRKGSEGGRISGGNNKGNSKGSSKGKGNQTKNNKLKTINEKGKIPPSIKDVFDYFKEKGVRDESEAFYHFYESKGWMVGKNKMKNWKGAVSGWIARNNLKDKKEVKLGRNGKPLKQGWI